MTKSAVASPKAQSEVDLERLLPSQGEARLARRARGRLERFRADRNLEIRVLEHDRATEQVVLPASAVRLLLDALEHLGRGNAVRIVPVNAEMTTQQAADLLDVSRPYLVRLLDEGTIPHRKVGTHRRVRTDDVLAYRRQVDQRRRRVLDQLATHDQELGLD